MRRSEEIAEMAALRAQVEELERTTHLLSVCLEPTFRAERDQARRDRDRLDHEKAQLKAEVEELTRDLDQVQRWADGLVTETQRLQGIEQAGQLAEEKLAEAQAGIEHWRAFYEETRAKLTEAEADVQSISADFRNEHAKVLDLQAKLAAVVEAGNALREALRLIPTSWGGAHEIALWVRRIVFGEADA
jgi:chromosome segregation ATPase